MKGKAAVLTALLIAASCGSPPVSRPTPTATIAASSDTLAQLRARGSIVTVVRVGTSPGGQQLDVAHSQKRALETAVATALAKRVLGDGATVQFRELGRDRWSPVERGEADMAMVSVAEAPSPGIVITVPYAAGGVVIAVRGGSQSSTTAALAGQKLGATTMGELNANEIAQTYLRDKGISATVTAFPGLAAAVAALDSGEVTAVIGDRTGIALLQRARSEPLKVIEQIASRPYVVAVRVEARPLHAALDAALRDLLASGEIQRMATSASFPYEAP